MVYAMVYPPRVAGAHDISIRGIDTLQNGNLEITYDIIDEHSDRRFSVYLCSSFDNYIQPLNFVSGDDNES